VLLPISPSRPVLLPISPSRPTLSSPLEDGSPIFRSQSRVRRPRVSQQYDTQDIVSDTAPALQDNLPTVVAVTNNLVPMPTADIHENENLSEPETAELIEGQVENDNPGVSEEVNIPPNANQMLSSISSSSNVAIEASNNDNAAEFQPAPGTIEFLLGLARQFDNKQNNKPVANPKKEKVEESKTKKRKAAESVDADDDDGSVCTICLDSWSNSGEHRIVSLKCGHFFGNSCIEKWLRGGGTSCPNCKGKSTKKDIRIHYVTKLKAIDSSEKDRALLNLEETKVELQELQLRNRDLQIRLQQQSKQVYKLNQDIKRFRGVSQDPNKSSNMVRLVFQKRHEICKPTTERDKCCRVLTYSQSLGMLVVSQGSGVRRYSMLNRTLGNIVGVHGDIIRELVFHPIQHELLLSCGQDKLAKITNMSTCQEVTRFETDSEVWAAEWSHANPNIVFLGTKRSQILIYNTHSPASPPTTLTFPGAERRPIISLKFVPAAPDRGFPFPGLLAMTLGSLWFCTHQEGADWVPHRLPIDAKLLWSMEFEPESRLLLVSCRPAPQAVHLILELNCIMEESGPVVTSRTVMKQVNGGSYSIRSFLRSTLISGPNEEALLVFGRGTGPKDHRVIVQEVGSGRIVQDFNIGRPVLDLCQANINGERHLAVLGETDLTMYKWQ